MVRPVSTDDEFYPSRLDETETEPSETIWLVHSLSVYQGVNQKNMTEYFEIVKKANRGWCHVFVASNFWSFFFMAKVSVILSCFTSIYVWHFDLNPILCKLSYKITSMSVYGSSEHLLLYNWMFAKTYWCLLSNVFRKASMFILLAFKCVWFCLVMCGCSKYI